MIIFSNEEFFQSEEIQKYRYIDIINYDLIYIIKKVIQKKIEKFIVFFHISLYHDSLDINIVTCCIM